jgi:transcription antitermination factor NusG
MSATHEVKDRWYVIVSKAIHYKKAAAILEKLGFSFYLPTQRQLHYWSDRKKWIDVPILNPYIFLFSNDQGRKLLFQSCSSFHFLTCKGKLANVKEEEIEKVRRLCNYAINMKMEQSLVKKGDLVEIINGPLTGMYGYALKENGKHRFFVQILSLGQFASVDIESHLLRVC